MTSLYAVTTIDSSRAISTGVKSRGIASNEMCTPPTVVDVVALSQIGRFKPADGRSEGTRLGFEDGWRDMVNVLDRPDDGLDEAMPEGDAEGATVNSTTCA